MQAPLTYTHIQGTLHTHTGDSPTHTRGPLTHTHRDSAKQSQWERMAGWPFLVLTLICFKELPLDAERPAVMINAKRIKPPFGPLAGEMAWLIKVRSTKTDDLSLPSTHKLWLIRALYSRETTGELKYCTGLPFLPAASLS